MNHKMYFNVASIDLSAKLAVALTSNVKRRFGKLGYALAAAHAFAGAHSSYVELPGSGRKFRPRTLQGSPVGSLP